MTARGDPPRLGVPAEAGRMVVRCGSCGHRMAPERAIAHVSCSQWPGMRPYWIVEWRCPTPNCGGMVALEVDDGLRG